jgi:hypothetical protein
MIAISFALGLSQLPAEKRLGICARSLFRDAQLPASLCADRFGGATTAVTGYTKNLSRREQLAGACDDDKLLEH